MFSSTEIVIETYVAANILWKKEEHPGAAFLKIPDSVCFEHLSMRYKYYQCDLHHFETLRFEGLQSYTKAFQGIYEALWFLNLKCGIVHADVAATNILINFEGTEITEAVLGDYSLCTNHDLSIQIILMAEQAEDSMLLPRKGFTVSEMYQTLYRPLLLHYEATVNPKARVWKLFRDPKIFLMLDLCALGQVIFIFLLRLLQKNCRCPSIRYDRMVGKLAYKVSKARNRDTFSQVQNNFLLHLFATYRRLFAKDKLTDDMWIMTHLSHHFRNDVTRFNKCVGFLQAVKTIDSLPFLEASASGRKLLSFVLKTILLKNPVFTDLNKFFSDFS